MFQVSLSSPLIVAILALTILTGCAANNAPSRSTTVKVMSGCDCAPMQDWLKRQQDVSEMSIEEVAQALAELGSPKGVDQLFYYGLLNQQTDVFTKWAEARDAFRRLAADDNLIREQRRLAAVLERYNQSRINWHEQNKALQDENLLLEQKIEAITELETTISTRKEQEGHDAPVAPGR
jgi:hypothetical protein